MHAKPHILCIVGPTASGKSSRAVDEAIARDGEVISVDSRQVYRGLDIGTEKVTREEMRNVPHHLIDTRDAGEAYSAGDFVTDAIRLIEVISSRGKLPILVGGSHFYFDALLRGLPEGVDADPALRADLEKLSTEDLHQQILSKDPRRAERLDPHNRRRLIRALEIISKRGIVPNRPITASPYQVEWIMVDPPREKLRPKIDDRLQKALARGLIDEVRAVREQVGDARIHELGLEYKIVAEYLRGERTLESLLPTLSAKLWQYARRQKAWVRKLRDENPT